MIVLAGTSDGIRAVGTDLPRMPAGHRITALAPSAPGVWAITDGDTIWFDPGAGEGEPVARVESRHANCVLSTGDGTALVGTDEAGLYRIGDGEIERVASFDATPGRDGWYTPWGGPPDVRSMAMDADGTLYVNVHVGGVVCSGDSGETWRDTMDIDNDVHEVVAHPNRPGYAFAAAAVGAGFTTDGAQSWTFETEGMHAFYCRAVALSDEMLFVSASRGSRGAAAAVYRRPLAGGPFAPCTAGLPEWFSTNVNTGCIAASGRTVAVGDEDGTIYVSEDDGESWHVAESGLPGVSCVAIV